LAWARVNQLVIDELVIKDLGVIAEARLPLGPGFTAITGETGAGKTMVVTALGLLMGARADTGAVRQGADRARVAGVINVASLGDVRDQVDALGGEVEHDELLLSRSVSNEGRSRATVGGAPTPVSALTSLAEHLFVVHGQSDQLRLRSAHAQREALDRFGGETLARTLANYQTAFTSWRELNRELEDLTASHAERGREAARLAADLSEIESIAPEPGEDVALAEMLRRLEHSEALRQASAHAHEILSSETGDPQSRDVSGMLNEAKQQLERVIEHDPALAPILEALANASFAIDDAATELARYAETLDADGPQEFERVQQRKAALTQLTRKFGPELTDVLAYAETGASRLTELHGDDSRIDELAASVALLANETELYARELTTLRSSAAEALAVSVTAELAALALPDAQFVATITPALELNTYGADEVSFLLKPHAGAEPRPLAKGASGGELSRVMLALEVVIAGVDPVPTFVFDEVDSGVGGAAAIEIGRRLARLAETAQVIVVTHLAQVAAFANNHLQVVKDSTGGFTESSCKRLDAEARVAEMARLLSGMTDSASALEHAAELLALRQNQ
jgi:DNA repair protein RecN (Recombination protein N)